MRSLKRRERVGNARLAEALGARKLLVHGEVLDTYGTNVLQSEDAAAGCTLTPRARAFSTGCYQHISNILALE